MTPEALPLKKRYILAQPRPVCIHMRIFSERPRRKRRTFWPLRRLFSKNTSKLTIWSSLFWDFQEMHELIILRSWSNEQIHYSEIIFRTPAPYCKCEAFRSLPHYSSCSLYSQLRGGCTCRICRAENKHTECYLRIWDSWRKKNIRNWTNLEKLVHSLWNLECEWRVLECEGTVITFHIFGVLIHNGWDCHCAMLWFTWNAATVPVCVANAWTPTIKYVTWLLVGCGS